MVEFIIRRMEEKRESLRTRNAYNVANPKHMVLHQEVTNSAFCGTGIENRKLFQNLSRDLRKLHNEEICDDLLFCIIFLRQSS